MEVYPQGYLWFLFRRRITFFQIIYFTLYIKYKINKISLKEVLYSQVVIIIFQIESNPNKEGFSLKRTSTVFK